MRLELLEAQEQMVFAESSRPRFPSTGTTPAEESMMAFLQTSLCLGHQRAFADVKSAFTQSLPLQRESLQSTKFDERKHNVAQILTEVNDFIVSAKSRTGTLSRKC